MLRFIAPVFMCLAGTGCGPSRPAVAAAAEAPADGLLFLAYEVTRAPGGGAPSVRLLQQLRTEGELPPGGRLPAGADTWTVHFLDARARTLEAQPVPDPLLRDTEGVDETGVLVHRRDTLARGELLLRVAYRPAMAAVRLEGPGRHILFEHRLAPKP